MASNLDHVDDRAGVPAVEGVAAHPTVLGLWLHMEALRCEIGVLRKLIAQIEE